eukprot:TRINITY_DN49884_c0_g1_i1.p1 TRINITY_DN49884_c0_g1~~TRINITY_DN49884_c0_g1_i1.p1  ORF type:complete len:341 (+),score=61.02 TRINITY_DN49884_c0_g1_i1:135-1157(+)
MLHPRPTTVCQDLHIFAPGQCQLYDVDVHKLRLEQYRKKGLDPRLRDVLERRRQKQTAAAGELEAVACREFFAAEVDEHSDAQPSKKKAQLQSDLFISEPSSENMGAATSTALSQEQFQKQKGSQKQTSKDEATVRRGMQSAEEHTLEKMEKAKHQSETKARSSGKGDNNKKVHEKSKGISLASSISAKCMSSWQNSKGTWEVRPWEQTSTYASNQSQELQYAHAHHGHQQHHAQLHNSLVRYDRTPSPTLREMPPTEEGCRRMGLLLQQAQHSRHYDERQQQTWQPCEDIDRQQRSQSVRGSMSYSQGRLDEMLGHQLQLTSYSQGCLDEMLGDQLQLT